MFQQYPTETPNKPRIEEMQTTVLDLAYILNKLPMSIFFRSIDNFPDLCTEIIELIGADNFQCKSTTIRI